MHIPTRSKCDHEGPLETVKHFTVDTKQEENEDLMTHTKQFKQANNTFKQLVSSEWMNEFVKHASICTATTDATEQAEILKEGPEKFTAFTHMKNSEPQKHSELSSNLKDWAMTNSQKP